MGWPGNAVAIFLATQEGRVVVLREDHATFLSPALILQVMQSDVHLGSSSVAVSGSLKQHEDFLLFMRKGIELRQGICLRHASLYALLIFIIFRYAASVFASMASTVRLPASIELPMRHNRSVFKKAPGSNAPRESLLEVLPASS